MSLRRRVFETQQIQKDLVGEGYSVHEAIQLIQAAAMSELANCVDEGWDLRSRFTIQGGDEI